MLNNDDCVIGLPQIQCPSCGQALLQTGPRMPKLSKRQREAERKVKGYYAVGEEGHEMPNDAGPSQMAERTFVLFSCENYRCEQYTKFKVLELPRIKTSTAKVEL